MFLRSVRFRSSEYPVSDKYPFNMGIFRSTPELVFSRPVTFFSGENGSGKSTLLKALAMRCGIHIWGQEEGVRLVKNRYEKALPEYMEIDWTPVPGTFFASEIFRHFALLLDEWAKTDPDQLKYFGGESLITRSHGQCHMTYFRTRFRIEGLYFLDEPENALSAGRQIELLSLLEEYSKLGNVQFVVCTHSPILLSLPGAEIFSFDSCPIRKIEYRETEHFRIYRDFFSKYSGI